MKSRNLHELGRKIGVGLTMDGHINTNLSITLTLEPFSKLVTLIVFWGPFGPHCSYGLPIHEYVTYLTTHVAVIRTATKYAISMQPMWSSFERQSV